MNYLEIIQLVAIYGATAIGLVAVVVVLRQKLRLSDAYLAGQRAAESGNAQNPFDAATDLKLHEQWNEGYRETMAELTSD